MTVASALPSTPQVFDVLRPWLERMPFERRDGLAPATIDADGFVQIACDAPDRAHRARIVGDRMELLDHDVEAELAMLVFGGDLPICLLYAAAWDGARSGRDNFLGEWAEDVDGDRRARAQEDWHGNYWESWPSEPSPARALFGGDLQQRLAMAVASSWLVTRGPAGPGAAWRDVRRAVALRARRSLVLSLASVDAHRRPDALVPVLVTVSPASTASIAGRLSRRGSVVEVGVPSGWLSSVWGHPRGALNEGRFVLARHEGHDVVVEWLPTGRIGREHEAVTIQVPREAPAG